uniref:Uncharacterized protein n=1 Tax=Sipha flava TaxID=143950 RepID=A0A2S2QYJ7_9HEMI
MGSYTFHVAVIAISCIALQGVSYAELESNEPFELDAPEEVAIQYDCDEYQAKIWDKALDNMAAMEFVKNTLGIIKEAGTNEVCSDTIRSLINFIKVTGASPNAHYSFGMMMKMIAVIIREIDTSGTSDQLKETGKVFNQIVGNNDAQDLTLKFIRKSMDLLKNPMTRERLFKMLKAIENAMKPSESEMIVKNRLNQVKGIAKAPVSIVKGAFGRVGNMMRSVTK